MLHVTSLDFSFSGRVVKTLQDTEITGFYFDLLKFLLTAIFNLQEEEEAEEQELESNAEAYEGTVVHSRFSRVVFQVALLTKCKVEGFCLPSCVALLRRTTIFLCSSEGSQSGERKSQRARSAGHNCCSMATVVLR